MKVLSKRPMNAVWELRALCCVYTVSRYRASRSTPLSLAVNFNRIQSRHKKGRLSSLAATEKSEHHCPPLNAAVEGNKMVLEGLKWGIF